MPDLEFLFELQLADAVPFDAMLTELAACVLRQLGCSTDASSALVRSLQGELEERIAAGHQACHVRFRVCGRDLEVVVAYLGGHEWRAKRSLP